MELVDQLGVHVGFGQSRIGYRVGVVVGLGTIHAHCFWPAAIAISGLTVIVRLQR